MKRDPADNGGAGETYMEISTTGRDETRRHCDGDETTQTSFLGTSIFSCVTDACNDCPENSRAHPISMVFAALGSEKPLAMSMAQKTTGERRVLAPPAGQIPSSS